MSEGYNVIIKDVEFEMLAEKTLAFCKNMENCLEQYNAALTKVTTCAIPSGDVHDALVLFAEYAKQLEGLSAGIGDKFSRLVKQFIRKIRIASGNGDFCLYSKDSDDTRDFTQKEYEAMLSCIDKPWSKWTDNAGDKILEIVDGVADWFGIDNLLESNRKLWFDYNDVTKQDLLRIFEQAHELDEDYGRSIAGGVGNDDWYTSHFAFAVIALADVRDMMNAMEDIIGLHNGPITVDSIETRLHPLFSEMLDDYMKLIAVPEDTVEATIEIISDFVSQPWADTYFSGFYVATAKFVGELDGLDAVNMVLFQMFDIGTGTALNGDYETYIKKKQLMQIIEEMAVEGLYTGSEYEESVDDAKAFLKYLKSLGKDGYDYLNTHRYGKDKKLILDGRTIEARKYRELLEGLSDAKTYLEYGEQGIDCLARILADTSKGLEIIESLEANCQGDPDMVEAVKEIRDLYSKEANALLKQSAETLAEVALDGGTNLLAEVSPVVKILQTIDGTIDKIGDITGLGPEARSTYNALAGFNMSRVTEDAYVSAINKLREADPNSAGYEELAENVKNCFEIHKRNEVEMFKNMADASYGTAKSYYRYCMGKAEQLSLGDTAKPDIMSYEQYTAAYGV